MDEEGAIRRVLDGALDAVVAFDQDATIVGWNRAAAAMFGWSKDEALGRTVDDTILEPGDRASLACALRGAPDALPQALRECTVRDRHGTQIPVEVSLSATPVDGCVVFTAFLRDIRARKEAERVRETEHAALAAVARATRRLSRATMSDEVRQALCDAALQVCGASIAFLAEPDPDSGDLIVTAKAGHVPVVEGLPTTLGPGTAVHHVHHSGEPLLSADARLDPRAANEAARAAGLRGGLLHPVRRGGVPLGVLAVAWPQRMEHASDQMRTLMGMLSDEGAIALARAEVFSGLASAARTDPLTGLANLRAWDEALSREIARATRHGRPFSILMLDFDGLKAVNDSQGHQAGDRALRTAVSAWLSILRASDLLARVGGDEFAAALPHCDRDGAVALGERLRASTPSGETCSVGVAEWRPGETEAALCERADQALYAAKGAGRNRTVAAP